MKWKMQVQRVEVLDALWHNPAMVEVVAVHEDGASFTWRTFDEPPRVGETVTVEVLG